MSPDRFKPVGPDYVVAALVDDICSLLREGRHEEGMTKAKEQGNSKPMDATQEGAYRSPLEGRKP
jgi:hypothetical protein